MINLKTVFFGEELTEMCRSAQKVMPPIPTLWSAGGVGGQLPKIFLARNCMKYPICTKFMYGTNPPWGEGWIILKKVLLGIK